jgi:hypothetical protein
MSRFSNNSRNPNAGFVYIILGMMVVIMIIMVFDFLT